LDVVGRIGILTGSLGAFHEVEQAIKTDGRTPEGSKINSAHSQILLRAKWLRAAPDTTGARPHTPDPEGIRRPVPCWRKKILFGPPEFQERPQKIFAAGGCLPRFDAARGKFNRGINALTNPFDSGGNEN